MKNPISLLLAAALTVACTSRPVVVDNVPAYADSLTFKIDSIGVFTLLYVDMPAEDDSLMQSCLAWYVGQRMFPARDDEARAHCPAYEGNLPAFLAACTRQKWNEMESMTYAGFPEEIAEDSEEGFTRAEMQEQATSMVEEDSIYLTDCTMKFRKVYETDSLVSWESEYYIYVNNTAHPSMGQAGITLNKADGSTACADLLRDTDSPAFCQILKEALCQWYMKVMEEPYPTDDQLRMVLSSWVKDVNALPLPGLSPYLTAEGVALSYDEGELTAGSGSTVLILPYDKVQPFMK